MSTETPKLIRIQKVRRTRKAIAIDYKLGDEGHSLTSRDMPLPAFLAALDALPPLVCELLQLPGTYVLNMKAGGITLTDGENQQVTVVAAKSLDDCNSPFNIATPLRFMDLPEKEGSFTPALSEKQVALIDEVVEQAKAYILGQRAQGTLALDEDEEDGDADEAEYSKEEPLIKFAPEPAAKKKRGRKAKEESPAAAAGK